MAAEEAPKKGINSHKNLRRCNMKRLLQRYSGTSLALFSVALLIVTLVALAGCYGSKAPSIEITSPANGATIPAGNVTISVKVSNFNIVNKLGQTNVSGEGHIHYFFDVDAPTTQGQPAVTAPGTYAATTATSYTWPNVTPGTHTFSVELINNDHTPLNPPYVAKITVTVQGAAAPTISITSPTDGSTIPAGNVMVSVKVSNFNLVDKLGQANVSGEGHIHYFFDVDAPTTPGQPAVTAPGTYAATAATSYAWPNVTPGTHTFSVELNNNDHTPLVPPVVQKVTVTVTAGATPTPTPTPTIAPTPTPTPTPTGTPQSVTINLIAKNIAFNMSTITVPAGASVTVNFDNQDSGIPHNFAVYENLTGGGTKAIFVGGVIAGPKQITYHFTAPSASGSYFFECDIHPTIMNGSFVVTS